jgi:4-amino-4-deoxy-L-arabinose transferase-like glycosyltransferase
VEHGELGEGRGAVQEGRRPLADRAIPSATALGLCVVALALRLWGLGDKPLWTDEAFSWFDYRHSLGEIVGARLNVHPPLYGVVMWAWMPLAGESEYALRLPSALLSVLVVPAVWRLGARLGGLPTAFVAAASMTVAPIGLSYAREARMYGVVMSQAALALLAADRFSRGRGRGRGGWAGVAAACAAAVLTHYTAVAVWAAAALRGLLGDPARPRPRRPGWLAAQAAVAALAFGWSVVLWSNRDAWANLVWLPWTGRTRRRDMALDWLSAMAALPTGPNGPGDTSAAQIVGVALFGMALALGVAAALRPGARRLGLPLLLLALAPPLAIALLEYQRPGWHIRFVLVGMPAALLLAALGATSLRGRLWPASGVLVVGLMAGQLWGFWLEWRKPAPASWRAVAAAVRADAAGSKVALGGVGSLASYYLQSIVPTHQRPVAIGRAPEEVAADLDRAVAGASVVWMAPHADALMDPGDLVGTLLNRYAVGREERDLGGLRVARIELRPGARIALGPPLRPAEAAFGDAVRLLGYAAERAGGAVALSLEMRVDARLPTDYKVFAHLLDGQARTIAQRDVVLLDAARRTTSQVEPGTRLRLELAIEGAADLLAGGRAIGVGLYEAGGAGARLALAPPAPEHRLVLPID